MGFQISVSIGYRDIFDDYETVNLKELIKDIPTKNSLEIIGYFLVQLHELNPDQSKQIDFLEVWLRRLPGDVHEKINKYIKLISSKKNSQFNFINNISGLVLIEELIENKNQLQVLDNLTPTQELNLFKAYLFCSQKWIEDQHSGFTLPKTGNEEDFIKILLPTQLPFEEILGFKDFSLQFIKAIYFFRFCEVHPEFKIYLTIFLKEYKLDSWQNYLKNIVSVYIRKFERLKTPSIISVPDSVPSILSFLEELSINPNKFKKSKDFSGLREKPVYRINENDFLFLNLNFLVDKIYQGIQFDFARILVKNCVAFKGKLIKSSSDFLSIFGNEFSETGLFYNIMEYAFEKSGYIKFKGEQIKKILFNSEPDYYIRDKAKIYIFEFKNIYLGAPVKYSFEYELIKSEIFKKLVTNENKSPKGVTQLVNVIEKIRANEFGKFDPYDFDSTIIYPIIVYVDFTLNSGGINYILNKEFKKQIADKNFKNAGNIKDLILINLDTFIKFQDLFRNKTLKLNNCFNEYYTYLKNSKDISKHISTFDMFIHDKTDKIKYDVPKMLIDEVLKLVSTDVKVAQRTTAQVSDTTQMP